MAADSGAPRRGCLGRWLRIVGIGLVGLLLLSCLAGQIAKAVVRADLTPPGQLVQVEGRTMHLHCTGSGSPTVILEGGQGELGLTWASVQPALSERTRVCSYDRAGLGWSAVSAKSPTAESAVADLHALLAAAKIEPPYVLVGHSIGGLYSLLYADTYPEEVAGLVLVDSAHYEQLARAPEGYAEVEAQATSAAEGQISVIKPLIALGVTALNPAMLAVTDQLPEAAQAQYNGLLATDSTSLETNMAEFKAAAQTFEQLRAAQISSLGNIPLAVLTRGKAIEQPAGVSNPELLAQAQQTQLGLQKEFLTLSPNAWQTVVPESGHNIQIEAPQAVIDATLKVLDEAGR